MKAAYGRLGLLTLLLGGGALLGVGVATQSALAVAGMLALAAVACAVVWPRWILVGLLAYIPLETFVLKWLPGGIAGPLGLVPEVLLFLAGISAFMKALSEPDSEIRIRWILLILAFVAAGMIAIFVGGTRALDGIYWLRTNIRYTTAALIVGSLGNRAWWVGTVARVVAGSVVVQALIAFAQLVGGPAVSSFFAPASVVVAGREFVDYGGVAAGISGTLGFYNNFGLFSAMSAVVCLGAFVSLTQGHIRDGVRTATGRWLAVGGTAAVLSVLMSGSRQALIVMAVALMILVLISGFRRLSGRMIPIMFVLLVFTAATMLLPQLAEPLSWIPSRFQQAITVSSVNASLQSDRLFAVARVVPAVLAFNPITGLGPGALSSGLGLGAAAGALSLSSSGVSYVQDVGWAGMLVQMGILGFSLLAYLLVSLVWRARRLFREGTLDRGALATVSAAMTIWGLAMVASSPLFIRSVSLILWSVAGLCLGGFRRAEPEVSER